MRIPVLEGPDVAPSGPVNAHVQYSGLEAASGQPMAQAISSAGQQQMASLGQYVDLYNQATAKARAASVASAITQYQQKSDDLTTNPETGILFGKGEQAMARANGDQELDGVHHPDGSGTYTDQLDNYQARLEGALNSKEEKKAFAEQAQRLRRETVERVERHVYEQHQVELNNTINETQLDALRHLNTVDPGPRKPGDEGVDPYDVQRERVLNAVNGLATSQADRELRMQKYDEAANETRVRRLLDSHMPEQAEAVLNSPFRMDKDNNPISVRAQLGDKGELFVKAIEQQKLQIQTDKDAMDLFAKNTDATGRPIEGAIYQKADELAEDKPEAYREQLQHTVDARMAHSLRAYNQVEGDRFGRVQQGIENSGGYLDRSSEDFQALNPENKASAGRYANTIIRATRGMNSEEERKQRDENRFALASVGAMDDKTLVGINPAQAFPKADPTTQKDIVKLQNKANERIQTGQTPKMDEFKQMVEASMNQAQISPQEKERRADMLYSLSTWREQWIEDHNGKPPTRKEINTQLAEELFHGPKHFYDAGEFRFEAERKGEKFIPGEEEDQSYGPSRDLARARKNAPAAAAAPVAPKTPAPKLQPVTKGGETRYWSKTQGKYFKTPFWDEKQKQYVEAE